MSKKRSPLFFTIALSCIAFFFAVMSSINFYGKLQEKEYKAQQASLKALSTQSAVLVEATLDGYYGRLLSIAEFVDNEPFLTGSKLAHMANIAKQEGFYRLGLITPDGTLTVHDGHQVDISDRPYFREILQGRLVLTGVRDSRLTSDKIFVLAVPVISASGKVLGGVHCSVQLDNFSLHLGKRFQEDSHHPHIIDRNGIMILPCQQSEASWTGSSFFTHMEASPNGLPLAIVQEKVRRGETVLTEIVAQGVPMQVYLTPLKRSNWVCAVTLPTSEAQKHLGLLFNRDLVVLLLNVFGPLGFLVIVVMLKLRSAVRSEYSLRQGLLGNVLGFVEVDLDTDRILHTSETPIFANAKNMPFSQAVQQVVQAQVHSDFRDNLMDALSRERIQQMFSEITHSHTVDFLATSDDGNTIWMECKINIKVNPDNGHLTAYCIFRDINEKKAHEALLRKRAERDALTGLYNRTAGCELIDAYLKEHSRDADQLHAFIILDLDNFKNVNDKLGHLMGDQALKDTARCFMQNFRREDICCRLGGDEFVVFMKDVTLEMVEKKLDTVLAEMHRTYGNGSVQVSISASAGFVLAPRHGKFFKELYPRADSALYIAKDNGKGSYTQYAPDAKSMVFSD